MLKINRISKEKRIAKKVREMLNKRGFIVKMQLSKKSNSVYLTIDNGACGGIRISNHKNNITKYKFNMIKDYKGKRTEYSNGVFKKFYNFNSIGRLIADIEIERSNMIIKYGYANYKRTRDKENIIRHHFANERQAA